jgi:myo-inositol-1(or 4)-monophosphatase
MKQFTITLARQAGEVLKTYYRRQLRIKTKSNQNDLVTQADVESEQLILAAIQEHYPNHAVLAEESGGSGQSDYIWVIDPLDGTTNFAHHHPHFSISICLTHQYDPVLAVVFDPLRDELFVAEKGRGATLNGQPIAVASASTLAQALLATGFPNNRTGSQNNLPEFARILLQIQGVRRSGSAALDLAYVACGRLDGYWELSLNPWDWMGGILLVHEAGGIVTTTAGTPMTLETPSIVAGNPAIQARLIDLLQG